MKSKRFYNERVAYMRGLAKVAQTEALKASCLKAAEDYAALLMAAEEEALSRMPEPDGAPRAGLP